MAEFWNLTPRETYAAIDAWTWRQDLAHRRDAWLAWHTAALSRARRMPTLSRFITPPDAQPLEGEELEKRRQERDEMLERIDVDKLNEAMRKKHGG